MESKTDIRTYLSDEFGLSTDIADEMINEYTLSMRQTIDEATAFAAAENWDSLNHAGHSIKGCSQNIGAETLAIFGTTLQQAAASNARNTAESELTKFISALTKFQES